MNELILLLLVNPEEKLPLKFNYSLQFLFYNTIMNPKNKNNQKIYLKLNFTYNHYLNNKYNSLL